jgi:hypothetical protein
MAVQVAEQTMNDIREFATEFQSTTLGRQEMPVHFNALHGKGCRIERNRSATMLVWEDCKPNQQVGCFSIAKPIPTNGATVLTIGVHVPGGVTLAVACCVDGCWTLPEKTEGGSDVCEISIPIQGETLDQVALSVVDSIGGPKTVIFPWFSLHSGLSLV